MVKNEFIEVVKDTFIGLVERRFYLFVMDFIIVSIREGFIMVVRYDLVTFVTREFIIYVDYGSVTFAREEFISLEYVFDEEDYFVTSKYLVVEHEILEDYSSASHCLVNSFVRIDIRVVLWIHLFGLWLVDQNHSISWKSNNFKCIE